MVSLPFLSLFVTYLAALTALAWTQRRRAVTPAGFYLGDRRFGALPTGFSLAATTIGASAILTEGELVYSRGVAGVWMDLAGALGLGALGMWLVPRVRAGARTSLAEIAGALFGPRVRVLAALLAVAAEVGWLALLLRGAESILVASGEVRPGRALALAVAAFVGYTCIGGQHAVTWSDVVQFSVMCGGLLLVALPAALVAGGAALWRPGPAWNFPWGADWPPQRALEMLLMVGLPHLVGSDVYAKVLAARDESSARRGALFAAAAKAVFGVAIALMALAARQGLPGLQPAAAAVPAYLKEILPSGLHLVVLLALMATVVSSADTVLLTATTILLHDLLPGIGWSGPAAHRPAGAAGGPGGWGGVGTAAQGEAGDATVGSSALVARWVAIVVLASLAVLLALRLGTMMKIFTWAYSLFAAGLSLPILIGLLLGGRLPGRVARAGMATGAACAAGAGLRGAPLPVVFGLAGCVLAMTLVWRFGGRGSSRTGRVPGGRDNA